MVMIIMNIEHCWRLETLVVDTSIVDAILVGATHGAFRGKAIEVCSIIRSATSYWLHIVVQMQENRKIATIAAASEHEIFFRAFALCRYRQVQCEHMNGH